VAVRVGCDPLPLDAGTPRPSIHADAKMVPRPDVSAFTPTQSGMQLQSGEMLLAAAA
jgi:hypothetical protein